MLGFCNAALFLHTLVIYCAYFLRYVSWRRLRLGDASYLGDTLSWQRLLSWRRARLAAPSFLATRVLGNACRHFEREKDKD